MLSKNLKFIFILVIYLVSLPWVQADDTDIYLNGASPNGKEPLVMFAIDYRSNLTSTDCNHGVDADIIANCTGYTADFVTNYIPASYKADGKITLGEKIRAVLRQTMDSLSGVKVGLMLSHNNTACGASGKCSDGGYILMGFQSIDGTNPVSGLTYREEFFNKLDAFPGTIPSDPDHPWQERETYFELFRYLTGQNVYFGHLGYQDFDDPGGKNVNLDVDTPAMAWDSSIESGNSYVTPFIAGEDCVKVFVINIIFGTANQASSADADIEDTKGNGGMDGVTLVNGKEFETVLAWLNNNDLADGTYGSAPDLGGEQNVTSYFIVKGADTTSNKWANAGGSGLSLELDVDPEELASTINNIFVQILSVSTTFVSASVPVNVFNRAEFLDDVYIALFEAEENAKPKWVGNLKKLKLTVDGTGAEIIGDANGDAAFATDGRIKHSALTFWTNPNGADVQAFDTDENEEQGKDGRSVDRGGAGQQVTGFLSGNPGLNNSDTGARQIFTEPNSYTNGTATSLRAFNATAAEAENLWADLNANGYISSGSTLNASSWSAAADYASATVTEQTEALDILKFARGIDVTDEDGDTDYTDGRPWMLGDSIHSRPLTINYGATTGYSASNPDVRIIMGGNDGFLRMFRNTTTAGAESGEEVWSFIPRSALAVQHRLKNNTAGTPIHPYGVDGAPVALVIDNDRDGTIEPSSPDNDKVYLFFGMRRGGKAYYAMDLSDPDDPKMLWSIDKTDTDFQEMGLTFSIPRVTYLNYDSYIQKPVLIFGGGYDVNKDTRGTAQGTNDSEGNAVYIVDAATGSLIWKIVQSTALMIVPSSIKVEANLVDSIPSDITAVDTDGDSSVDRLYFGDTGGTIWRADLYGSDRTNWTVNKLAVLGRHYASGKDNDRRFFHRVDFVQTRDSTGEFDAVIIGSGDRPNPMDIGVGSDEPENWFYMIKDRGTKTGFPMSNLDADATNNFPDTDNYYDHDDFSDLSNNCFQDYGVSCTSTQTDDLVNGWKIELEDSGEKALSTPITLGGMIFFTTYVPPDGASGCGPSEGSGLLYAVNLQDATAVQDFDQSNAVTDAGTGEVYELQKSDRSRETGDGIPADVISIGMDKVLPPGGNPITVPIRTRWRTFWYVVGE